MLSHKEDTNRKVRRDGTQIYMKEHNTPRAMPIKEDVLYSRHEAAPHRPTRPGNWCPRGESEIWSSCDINGMSNIVTPIVGPESSFQIELVISTVSIHEH